MDAFEYLAVLISIILGLGIAQLLGGFGRWVEQRGACQPFAPALIWAGILLLIHIQTWWSMFGLRFVTQWTFVRFAVLLQPIVLYLLAVLVLQARARRPRTCAQITLRSVAGSSACWPSCWV
jgi:hypothetical protein